MNENMKEISFPCFRFFIKSWDEWIIKLWQKSIKLNFVYKNVKENKEKKILLKKNKLTFPRSMPQYDFE